MTLFRAGVVAALLAATAVYAFTKDDVGLGGVLRYLFAISGVTFGITLAYALIIRRVKSRNLEWLAYAQILADTGLAAALLWITGGSDSPFAFLFSYGVINGAILLYRRGAMLAAGLSTLGYAAITLAMRNGWIVAGADYLIPDPIRIDRLIFSVGVNSGAFFLVAILGAYLGEQARHAGARAVVAEADLAALSALHERIVRSVSSGILTLDPEYRITFLNQAGANILGVEPEAAMGARLESISDPLLQALGAGAAAAPTTRGEVVVEGQQSIGFAVTALGARGEIVVVFQDLTSMKQMERKVRRNERLAAVGSLAAGLAHEIRNPLASMSGSIELLREAAPKTGPGDDSSALMAIVLREIGRLEGLIADFLSFARPRPPHLQQVELAPLLEDAVILFGHDPRASKVHLETHCDPGTEILADAEQIRQVVVNLLINAAQAREDATVQVRAMRREAVVVLEIEDDGPGMDEETLDRIFDPFFTTKKQGTGLGLALVHSIIEAHHAEIGVESTPGTGTLFRTIFSPPDPT